MNYALALVKLIRLRNCLIASSAVMVGGYLQTLDPAQPRLIYFALVAALICASGNALNDLIDSETDKLNHPDRPLPSGTLSASEAKYVTAISGSLGLTLSFFLSNELFLIALAVSALLIWYNLQLKRSPLIGNLLIAGLGAITVVSGGIASGETIFSLPGSIFPAALAFLLHLAREIVKDIQDLPGDRAAGYSTFPIRAGERSARRFIITLIILLIGLSLAPVALGWYNLWYVWIVILGVDLPLLIVLIWVMRPEFTGRLPETSRLAQTSLVFKFAMLMGLLAVALGGLNLAV